jgi:hypothetical protein
MSTKAFSVCVYCGSRAGTDPVFAQAARAVGAEIGRRGWELVYGGGKVGLMGVVVGVIPRILMEREVGHRGLHELHVVETMHQRKQMMAERSSVFIALPGGIGTMEELFEVWTWRQIGYHDQPIGLLNVSGYYDALLSFLQGSVACGFLESAQLQAVAVDDRPQALLDTLHRRAASATGADDYTQI